MKYTGLYIRSLFALILLHISLSTLAIELIDVKVPITLKKAYDLRYSDPLNCAELTNQYIIQQKAFKINNKGIIEESQPIGGVYLFPMQLLAFCYAQIEDYGNALNLLQPLLKNPSLSGDEIRTLIMIALDIPEEARPQLSNLSLLKILSETESSIQKTPLKETPDLAITLQLAIAKLSLQENHYRDALGALEKAKKEIKGNQNIELHAWLSYYYGLYYDQINQQQLAASFFLLANQLANKHDFIELSGQVKNSIANLYQKKYRFSTALDFTKQRIELYLGTQNKVKQAESLIQFAVLKRQNNENNEALIYLFNALDLIENNKHSALLAHVYLEIGRTYLANKNTESNNNELELAQKYLQNARFHFTRLDKPRYQIESLLLLAQLNLLNKDPALAILQLEKVLQLSTNNYLSLRVQAFEILALSYEITGDLQQAILHFKNFHALQNRIKERLFELQQLQISEQLALFEKTQQQEQLEIENTQLQRTTERFKTLAHSSMVLLTLVTLLLGYVYIANKKLSKSSQLAQQQLAVHPRSKLPVQYDDSDKFNAACHAEPLYYALVQIPFLIQINELLGLERATKIEEKLGEALKIYFTKHTDIFQLRDNQILFISKQTEHQSGGDFATKIMQFFTAFSTKNQLPNTVSCGVVAFPFLNNASRAITPRRILTLASLALFAASQIRAVKQQSSWVELYAIDNLQPAFFDGDLWVLGQAAIDKGIVKIRSSHTDCAINWLKFDN